MSFDERRALREGFLALVSALLRYSIVSLFFFNISIVSCSFIFRSLINPDYLSILFIAAFLSASSASFYSVRFSVSLFSDFFSICLAAWYFSIFFLFSSSSANRVLLLEFKVAIYDLNCSTSWRSSSLPLSSYYLSSLALIRLIFAYETCSDSYCLVKVLSTSSFSLTSQRDCNSFLTSFSKASSYWASETRWAKPSLFYSSNFSLRLKDSILPESALIRSRISLRSVWAARNSLICIVSIFFISSLQADWASSNLH